MRNVELIWLFGADYVIDYIVEDFVCSGCCYDVVLDLVGNCSLTDFWRVLMFVGMFVLFGGGVFSGGSMFGPMGLFLRSQLLSRFVRHWLLTLPSKPSKEN